MGDQHETFMQMAIDLAIEGINKDEGGPFGCIIVKNGEIIGKGNNKVTTYNDPTAHAEVVAIRNACKNLNHFQLEGCILYTSCEPCPMCLGAIYWARPSMVFFACTRQDAAEVDFDDDYIYREINIPFDQRKIPMLQTCRENSLLVFSKWKEKEGKVKY